MCCRTRTSALASALLLAVAMLASNCGGGSGVHLVSLSVTPSDVEATAPTGTAQFNVTGSYDYTPKAGTSVAPQWSSSDATVVTITGTGLATCIAAGGPVTVTATAPGAKGNVSATAMLTCLSTAPTQGIGKCVADGVGALTGYCVGVRGGVCREAYDPTNCPPQTMPASTQADQCAQSSFTVDASRSCTP